MWRASGVILCMVACKSFAKDWPAIDLGTTYDSHSVDGMSLLQTQLQILESIEATKTAPPALRAKWPLDVLHCPHGEGMPLLTTKHMTFADYDEVVASVQRLYHKLPETCNEDYCPQAHWSGCILRAAAHDFMDYKDGLGGSDGCFYLPDMDNKGLRECLQEGFHGVTILNAYEDFCSRISFADFLVISAEAVLNITRQLVLNEDPNRGQLDLRSHFRYGRTTEKSCYASVGRMPDAEEGCNSVNRILVQNLGLKWSQATALMGAHTIGEASTSRSGYEGSWTGSKGSRKFDNGYFTAMLLQGWSPELGVQGDPSKNQWMRTDAGKGPDKQMMLNSDMCLFFVSVENTTVIGRTATRQCLCAWTHLTTRESHSETYGKHDHWPAINKYNNGDLCGGAQLYAANTDEGTGPDDENPSPTALNFTKQRLLCCGMQDKAFYDDNTLDCVPGGPAARDVNSFSNDEDMWLATFQEAWRIAVTNGHGGSLKMLSQAIG
mmetsp:Transcript_33613/g.61849  ORF Transcript_33613/g.61849 Transcript_33613/m.61849 type:complete len:493 (-) Transcript_33613:90-1568(-)